MTIVIIKYLSVYTTKINTKAASAHKSSSIIRLLLVKYCINIILNGYIKIKTKTL